LRQEPAQQPLGLLVVECLLGRLVLHQLDAVEVPVAAHVADDRQVVQPLQVRTEEIPVAPHVAVEVFAFEEVEVAIATASRPGGRRT
jgi:hypothetical protein